MRLKRLEIQGFKSFGRPVCLEFGPGITAIVGPNGSGKSNISDALRWVMGEQSAKTLRGQKMEDIIFAGSDGKRPLGMAEVQLTLDNSQGFLAIDYAEVTITRRVYRSGDSEFFINKQNCRLRDIHDLFTDTGLGREGYAVIGQGQIDTVLSVRSEDRRILLEETAGIVKYRQRKEQALRKLEDTSTDLLRVTDILHELEGQLGPLEEQAKQARLYLDLVNQLQSAELDHYHLTWQGLESRWNQIEESRKDFQRKYDKCNEQLGLLEQRKAELEDRRKFLEVDVENKQQELVALNEAYNQGVHTIALHQDRLKNQKNRSEQLTGVIQEKDEEIERLQREDAELKTEFQQLMEQIDSQEQTIGSLLESAETLQKKQQSAQTNINQLKNDFFDFMRELAECRNFERSFVERRENLKTQISMGAREMKELTERIHQIEESIEELKGTELERAKRLEALRADERSNHEELESGKKLLVKCQNERRGLEGQLAEVGTRLKTLQELEEGYEGYAFGVRRVMQDAKMSSLVLGTVADVVRVPQGLETAFEVALGAGLQNLITANQDDAKALIAWLKKVRGGRITILPLDSVQGGQFSAQAKKELKTPGVLGSALDLLEFSNKYQPALVSLLGRVVITEDLDTSFSLKKRLGRFSRIVTRDGSVVFPGGAITGGSLNGRSSGLLTRKGELSDLEQKLDRLKHELASQTHKEQELAENITDAENELGQLQEASVVVKLELQSSQQRREQMQTERENLLKTKQELAGKTDDLKAVLENLDSERQQAATKVTDLELEEAQKREYIQQAETAFNELATAVEEVSSKQTKERVHLAELKGILENQRIQLTNSEQRQKIAIQSQTEAKLEIKAIKDQMQQNEQTIADTLKENEARKYEQSELEATLRKARQERAEVQAENTQLGTELISVEKEQLKRERSLYKWDVELRQLEEKKEQILSSLAEQELRLGSILTREVEEKESTLKRRIDRLRVKIRDLGMVNPGATEEYERVLERCSFLQAQLADLNEARESLQDVINEMDKLCRTKLRKVFGEVQIEFQKIFSQLFLGGTAELVLTDPESILTTGIDVMARPPGKKLQNLLLLSGGERALTAIALLFAIKRVKPTPFWVLDEIDAALDESNLGRFADLMEEFSVGTQFLVVTHRSRTMEAADTLYGVTMAEEAISQIISVALT